MLLSWCGTSHTIGEYVDALNLMHIFFFFTQLCHSCVSFQMFYCIFIFLPPLLRLMHLFNAETL